MDDKKTSLTTGLLERMDELRADRRRQDENIDILNATLSDVRADLVRAVTDKCKCKINTHVNHETIDNNRDLKELLRESCDLMVSFDVVKKAYFLDRKEVKEIISE